MVINLKVGLVIIIMFAIFTIVRNIKNGKLQLSFSIFSIITGIALIVALLIPSLVEKLAAFIGFEVASNMLFCISIFVILYLIFSLMIIVSDEHKKIVSLVQEISLLKERVNKLEKNQSNNK